MYDYSLFAKIILLDTTYLPKFLRSCFYGIICNLLQSISATFHCKILNIVTKFRNLLLGFTHVIRLALGGQAKREHGYRIELITYRSY